MTGLYTGIGYYIEKIPINATSKNRNSAQKPAYYFYIYKGKISRVFIIITMHAITLGLFPLRIDKMSSSHFFIPCLTTPRKCALLFRPHGNY